MQLRGFALKAAAASLVSSVVIALVTATSATAASGGPDHGTQVIRPSTVQYIDHFKVVAGFSSNDKATRSYITRGRARVCVVAAILRGHGGPGAWAFQFRGANGAHLWDSHIYDQRVTKCSPWFTHHGGVYTILIARPYSSIDAYIYTDVTP